jgi:hypothetical protein
VSRILAFSIGHLPIADPKIELMERCIGARIGVSLSIDRTASQREGNRK